MAAPQTGPHPAGGTTTWWPWAAAAAVIVAVAVAAVGLGVDRRRGLPGRPVTTPAALAPGGAAAALGAPPAPTLTAGPRTLPAGPGWALPPPLPPPEEARPAGLRLVVRVLGPLDVAGLRRRVRRSEVTRLLVALAVAGDRGLSPDEARAAISVKADKDPSAASLHSTASRLRAALPVGLLPDATATGGYRLAGTEVEVDWVTFSALVGRAEQGAGSVWAERAELYQAALGLVRGPALAGGGWEGIAQVAGHIDTMVESTALTSAGDALSADDPHAAEAVLAAGLRAVTASPRLWEYRSGRRRPVRATGSAGRGTTPAPRSATTPAASRRSTGASATARRADRHRFRRRRRPSAIGNSNRSRRRRDLQAMIAAHTGQRPLPCL